MTPEQQDTIDTYAGATGALTREEKPVDWARRPINRRAILQAAAAAGGTLAGLAALGGLPAAAEAAVSRAVPGAAIGITGGTTPIVVNRGVAATSGTGTTTLFSGLKGAIGCRYRLSHDQVLFVAYDSGELLGYPVHGPLYAVVPGPGRGGPVRGRFRGLRGSGYSQPEDVALSADDRHVYITERTGNLLRVALARPNRSAATVVSSGLTAPQQIALDEANDRALVVEYAAAGRLVSIDLTTGAQTTLVHDLDHPVGLALTSDGHYAYISEQAAGGGQVSRFDLFASGARTTVATGFTAPFFLTWSDASQTTLYMTERDPANRMVAIDLSSLPGTVSTLSSALPFRPSCVAVLTPDRLLVTSDSVISEVHLLPYSASTDLLLGIGFVPFNKIVGGLASTDPGYFFSVQNAPFAGQLPLMINHPLAYSTGYRYYTVAVDGVEQNATWSDYELNSAGQFVLQTIASVSGNYYAVRPPTETWLNAYLGFFVNSPVLTNGLRTITVRFYDSVGGAQRAQKHLQVKVDNSRCTAAIAAPLLDGTPADPASGVLTYARDSGGHPAGTVTLAFTAAQPNGDATYSFGVIRGITAVSLVARSGPVTTVASPITPAPSAGDLLGTLPIAGFAASVYVATTAIDGWSRQSQYDASAQVAFVLAPTGCGV